MEGETRDNVILNREAVKNLRFAGKTSGGRRDSHCACPQGWHKCRSAQNDMFYMLFEFLCSGKVYYELVDERARRKDESVAIVRIEKLYPWWPQLVAASIEKYGKLRECFWVQDEPCNLGAGPFVTPRIESILRHRGGAIGFECIARAESASPATGSHKAHVIEQQQILKAAFDPR